MRLFVVSDLHIRETHEPCYLSLVHFLNEDVRPGDIVVLAGDLFDLFVGNKSIFIDQYQLFLSALRKACDQGVQIHYIEGNHDFFMGKAFRGCSGLQVHDHHMTLNVDGRKFFIAHGDTVDVRDYSYRVMRMFFRSPLMRLIVLMMPGKFILSLGNWMARKSRGNHFKTLDQLPVKRRDYLRNIYRSYAVSHISKGFDHVVLGHCHDYDEMEFKVGDRTGQYVNVGFPPVHRTVLAWESGDPKINRRPFVTNH